jgi:hypothetical protein
MLVLLSITVTLWIMARDSLSASLSSHPKIVPARSAFTCRAAVNVLPLVETPAAAS